MSSPLTSDLHNKGKLTTAYKTVIVCVEFLHCFSIMLMGLCLIDLLNCV